MVAEDVSGPLLGVHFVQMIQENFPNLMSSPGVLKNVCCHIVTTVTKIIIDNDYNHILHDISNKYIYRYLV